MTLAIKDKEEGLNRLIREREEAQANASVEAARIAFEQSLHSLHSIRKIDIEEIKTYFSPPPAVVQLMDAIGIIFDRQGGWADAKKFLSSHSFMQKILSLDFKTISMEKVDKLRKFVDMPVLQSERLGNISIAARSLCMWLRSFVIYSKEFRTVRTELGLNLKRKALNFRMTKIDSERNEIERLLIEFQQLMSEYTKLIEEKRELVGKIALFQQVFSKCSIFDFHPTGKNVDPTSESQWIQQAFHCDEDGVVFADERIRHSHLEYQNELENLCKMRKDIATDLDEGNNQLEEIQLILTTINEWNDLEELLTLKNPSLFDQCAISALMSFMSLSSNETLQAIRIKLRDILVKNLITTSVSTVKAFIQNPHFQRVAYYDARVVMSTAMCPFNACKASFVIHDLTLALNGFHTKREKYIHRLQSAEILVNEKKERFDQMWSDLYANQPEFWTFEMIVDKIQ
ncbi:Dynein heavy chain 2, axonemal, partial [Nowakowskiella sp. JEL0078]